jgi:hypothetical protein
MFMGAEGPVFVLYDSGKVLYRKNGVYRLVQVDAKEKEELIADLNLKDTLFTKSRNYNATASPGQSDLVGATDNPTYTMFVNTDTLYKVSVYGYITSIEYRRRFPKAFLKAHVLIMNYENDNAAKWIPDKVQVLLSDYSNSPDIPIKWPKGWPDLYSPEAINEAGYLKSIFLDGKYLDELIKLLNSRHEKQAIEINDGDYFVGYRFPIPGLY